METKFISLGIGILLLWLFPCQVDGKQTINSDTITLTLHINQKYEVHFSLFNQESYPARTATFVDGFSVDWGDGKIDCTDNHVYSREGIFKVSIQAKQLPYFEIKNDAMTSLDVSRCKSLEYLYCESKSLSTLHVGKCHNLNELYCYGTLTSLDITQCKGLTILDCSNNKLSALDITNCSELIYLQCHGNDLTTLDLAKDSKLKYLNCSNNHLSLLNTNNCIDLLGLFCQSNRLSDLNLRQNACLQLLDCSNNLLYSLDIAGCTQLINVICFDNQFDEHAMSMLIQNLPKNKIIEKNTGLTLIPTIEVRHLSKENIQSVENKGWQVKYNKN